MSDIKKHPYPFIKMHGLGNDFIIFDARTIPLTLQADSIRALADRREGIGADQIIVLQPPHKATANLAMQIFNKDGTSVEACGNATRCVARLMAEEGFSPPFTIETPGGLLSAVPQVQSNEKPTQDTMRMTVDMGKARYGWQDIPLSGPQDTLALLVPGFELAPGVGVSIGNPHVVFFLETLVGDEPEKYGSQISQSPLFPQGVNVSFAQVQDPSTVKLIVWERGAGRTRACGTAACATAVAAVRKGLCERHISVQLEGGDLDIVWREDGHVFMSGPASKSFSGEVILD